MMKRILSLHFFFLIFFTANAGTIQKGYHGFADVGYDYCISDLAPATISVTTSHGYQFSPFVFLGAGIGFDFTGSAEYSGEIKDITGYPYEKRDATVDIPLFFNGRFNFTKTKAVPFIDLRAGAYVNNEGGYYINAMLGCRISLSDNSGLSFSVGVKGRKITAQSLNFTSGNKYNGYKTSYYYEDDQNYPLENISFKIGYDF